MGGSPVLNARRVLRRIPAKPPQAEAMSRDLERRCEQEPYMGAKSYCLITAVVFGLVSAAHLLRALYRWPVTIDGWTIPVWVSWAAVPAAAALCIWGIWMWNLEGGPREGPGEGLPTLE